MKVIAFAPYLARYRAELSLAADLRFADREPDQGEDDDDNQHAEQNVHAASRYDERIVCPFFSHPRVATLLRTGT